MSDTATAARLAREAVALLEQGSTAQAVWRLIDAAGLAYEATPKGEACKDTGRGYSLVLHQEEAMDGQA